MQICEISPLNDLQTSSQIAWLNRCKVTLVACVWFSQMLVFMCLLKSPAWIDAKSQELQMCEISPLLFSNVFSNRLIEQMQSHISCMCVIFSNVSFQVSSKIAYLNRCKVTRVADVQNFSNMSQKLPPAKFYSESSDFQDECFWWFLCIQSLPRICPRVALSLGLFSRVTFTFHKMAVVKWLFFFQLYQFTEAFSKR